MNDDELTEDARAPFSPYMWVAAAAVREFGEERVRFRSEDCGARLGLAVYRSNDPASNRVNIWFREGELDANAKSEHERRRWLAGQFAEVRLYLAATKDP